MVLQQEISAIILTGGKSTRMGTDKGLMEYRGRRMIDRAIDIVSGLSNEILISANNKQYLDTGLEVVEDKYKDIGPMGGLHACLSREGKNFHIVLAVDMPYVDPGLFRYLLNFAKGRDAVVPLIGEHIEPLVAIYSKNILGEMEKMIGEGRYKLADLLLRVNTNFVPINESLDFYHQKLFHNLNRPEDAGAGEI